MQTIYDWVTLTIFTGLVVLFLERSTSNKAAEGVHDSMFAYLAAAAMCAIANYIGNSGENVLAALVIAVNLVFIALVLRPIDFKRRR